MEKPERWRGLFSHPDRFERWQAYARRVEQKVGAFLQFDPELALADSTAAGSAAAPVRAVAATPSGSPWPACPSASRTTSPSSPSGSPAARAS